MRTGKIRNFFGYIRQFFELLFDSDKASDRLLCFKVLDHKCSNWEHRVEPGEEEHGKNYYKRYCVVCDKVQILMFHRYGNVRTSWVDEIKPLDIKLL
jgi:hypothetical protein